MEMALVLLRNTVRLYPSFVDLFALVCIALAHLFALCAASSFHLIFDCAPP